MMLQSMNLETWASMEVRFTFLRSHPREVQIDPVDVYHVKNGENLIETRDMESKEGKSYCKHPAHLLHLAIGPISRVPICGSQSLCFAHAAH